jgi:hypothetical protein
MELKPHGAAWIIATGMVLSSLIILAAADRASERLSRAMEKAGDNARPNIHVPQAPSSLRLRIDDVAALKVAIQQLQEAAPAVVPMPLEPADRARFARALVPAVQGMKDAEGDVVKEAEVHAVTASQDGRTVTIKGTLHYHKQGPSQPPSKKFYAILNLDGFGEYTGSVRRYDDGTRQKVLLTDIHIGRPSGK